MAGWLRGVAAILRQPTFVDAAITVASAAILGWALVAWLPAFLARSYGVGPEEAGFWLAGVLGVGTAIGALVGGAAADLFYARAPNAGLWLGFWTTLLSAPVLTLAFIAHSKALSLACVMVSGVTGAVCMGPVYAAVQDMADRRMRATIAAVFGVVNIVLGHAGGPLLVGAVSDLTQRRFGTESLRMSLALVSLLGFWPAIHLYRMARRGRNSMQPDSKVVLF